ncbi:MAG: 3-phosphoshikimate 1-carboxyvinyltransferase [Acidobacteriota bacterium]
MHKTISGRLVMPGDKSISHRAAMFAAIANGATEITNFATSVDCASTLSCLSALGVKIERDGSTVSITGAGKSGFKAPPAPLDCGNSGTTMRLLAGILAGQQFQSVLTGDESLQKRPMKRVIAPMTQMGASIGSQDGRAPLVINGDPLAGIQYTPPVASAQIKSCVLLAGLFASGKTSVIEAVPTRDHTERMLAWFGAPLDESESGNGKRLTIDGTKQFTAKNFRVPGDVSSSAFFMVAAACLPGSNLELAGVGLNPSRTAVIHALKNLGAKVEIRNERIECNEPVGDIVVIGGLEHSANENIIRGGVIANLIDEIPILAVFGTQLAGGLEVRDAAELRVKESDRIAAVVENLKRMGGRVTEFEDGFKIERSELHGATIDSFGDHRIAMAFGVAGLFAEANTEILDAECAGVSFPGFFETLVSVTT